MVAEAAVAGVHLVVPHLPDQLLVAQAAKQLH
jgi:hypothetical protein